MTIQYPNRDNYTKKRRAAAKIRPKKRFRLQSVYKGLAQSNL